MLEICLPPILHPSKIKYLVLCWKQNLCQLRLWSMSEVAHDSWCNSSGNPVRIQGQYRLMHFGNVHSLSLYLRRAAFASPDAQRSTDFSYGFHQLHDGFFGNPDTMSCGYVYIFSWMKFKLRNRFSASNCVWYTFTSEIPSLGLCVLKTVEFNCWNYMSRKTHNRSNYLLAIHQFKMRTQAIWHHIQRACPHFIPILRVRPL